MSNPKQLNYTQQLEHRLKMVQDDLNVIKSFIIEQGLDETFKNVATKTSDRAYTNIYNIDVACDLNDNASISWTMFS